MTVDEIRAYLDDPTWRNLRYFAHQIAADLSDLAALLLYDLQRRIKRQGKKLVRDRKFWTYDAMWTFKESHPYASESGIRKAFLALEQAGLIEIEKSGKYNKT